ncbi:hypothetical protein CDL58_12575, partial [Escherichia coli]
QRTDTVFTVKPWPILLDHYSGDCKGDVQAGFVRGTKDNALYVKIVRGSKTLRLYKVQTGY